LSLAAIEVRGLRTVLQTRDGAWPAVAGLDLEIAAGETLALVGESGCGKSMTALSIMRLLPTPPARIVAGTVRVAGQDLLALPEREMRRLRGRTISMIFQDPMSALNPVATVRAQLLEVVHAHTRLRGAAAERRMVELLNLVGIPDPAARLHEFPHRLSGGMAQRVMIAMAIACEPTVLLADEPTTALDVTVQAQVLRVLRDIQRRSFMAMLLITHDLGVVAETADRVAVMYAGHKVEEAAVMPLFDGPLHPYTRGLLGATPVRGATRLQEIPGQVPPLSDTLVGCAYAPRCPLVMPRCRVERPALTAPEPGRWVACFATGLQVAA
jgi:oligopeptide/dipeptide ABC transporter ATP-binding protein